MRFLILLIISIFSFDIQAQMEVDGEILFGNEWIDYEKTYAKIVIDKDGVYRVYRQELADSGIPVESISFKNLHIWNYGKEVGFVIGENDAYIEFVGEKNKSQLDKHLLDDPETILNRNYSLVTDNTAYFVTYTDEENELLYTISETDLTNNTLIAEPYYMHEEHLVISSTHYKPTESQEVRYSNVVSGEGYGTGASISHTIDMPISQKADVSIGGELFIRYGGNYAINQKTEITINGESQGIHNSNRDTVQNLIFDVSSSLMGDENVKVKIAGTIEGDIGIVDRKNVSEVILTYPRNFHLNEEEHIFSLAPSVTMRYIELEDYNGSELPIIYDNENKQKIIPQLLSNGKVAFFVSPSANQNRIRISNPSSTLYSAKYISERSFTSFADRTDSEYLMISSEGLRNQGATDWVKEYEDYRSSEVGGGHKTSLVNVEDLYDQFAYGVDRHFISLKNYIHWTAKTYDDPKFLFIIGKGIEYPNVRIDSVFLETTTFHVPSWGNPGSDNLIMRTKESRIPIFPVGRLAAGNADDVKNYLDKIKDHEVNINNASNIEDRLWQKNGLHLSGGDNNNQETLFNSLESMRDIIENNKFGADVSTFRKKSTDPIEDATSDLIFDKINNGLSLLTFFGHASVGAFDFNLDNVENYLNKGKYPLLMSLGCFSGNIHTLGDGGISEDFVLTKDKGAIAFVAASGTAFIGVQNQFGRELYEEFGGDSYGKSIGEAMMKVFNKFGHLNDFGNVTFYQQLTLHGDPALKLPYFRGPDYLSDASSVRINPTFVDTYEESFEVCFDVVNLGMNVTDSINVHVSHQNPSGEIEYVDVRRILGPSYSDNYCFTIPILSRELVGVNRILVNLDVDNEIEELPAPVAESNNILIGLNGLEGHEFIILNNSALPTFPEEYAIVNTEKVSLVANTFNSFGVAQDFYVEIDTTILFDSPLLQKRTVADVKSIARWDLDFALIDKTVYYWRIGSLNPLTSEIVWRESSFVYEPNQRAGWSQEHYFQFLDNDYTNLEYLDSSRQLKFVDNVKEITMVNGIASLPNSLVEFEINSSLWNRWRSNNFGIKSGVGLVVFDPIFGEALINYSDNPRWGSTPSSAALTMYFQFPTETVEQREHLINVLRDSLPEDHVVCVNFLQLNLGSRYNIEDYDEEINGHSIFSVLEDKGAQLLDELKGFGANPYLYVYENTLEEGEYKTLAEEVSSNEEEQVETLFQVNALWDRGEISSTLIGPAAMWTELEWVMDLSDVPENDTVNIDIIGVGTNGVETILFEDLAQENFDISTIDASEYPFLRLNVFSKDSKTLSTAMLNKLRVYYDGFGDLAIITDENSFKKDIYDEGEQIPIALTISNISGVPMQETKLNFTVIDDQNNSENYELSIPELAPNESTAQNIEIETKGLNGEHILQAQLNIDKNPMEKYYINNLAQTGFTIKPDTLNPIMNVTFDGFQIMNDDIVSSKPLIRVELDDSNQFLLLDNPENFIVSLRAPDQDIIQVLADDPSITFIAAESGSDNKAIIEYNPSLLEDGRYTLTVQSSDVSGNTSGNLNYEVDFRVYNEEMVSNVFNYPNPFSTSTQFVFTLTGDEEPGNILIRIMSISGKVVREITSAELGNLRIGINRTEYKWDGTDDFGEKLANGTYLYQVVTKKLDGSDYDHFSDPNQNNTDHLFTEGFGKLVIIR